MTTHDKYRFTNKEMLIELLDMVTAEFTGLCLARKDFQKQTDLIGEIRILQEELRSREMLKEKRAMHIPRKSA